MYRRRRLETISAHIDDRKEEMMNPALALISSTQKRSEILFVYNAEEYIKKVYVFTNPNVCPQYRIRKGAKISGTKNWHK